MNHLIQTGLFLVLAILNSRMAMAQETTRAPVNAVPRTELSVGEQRLLYVPGLKRYSLGGTSLKAQTLPREVDSADSYLLVKAQSPGFSDLWIWKEDGEAEHRPFSIQKTAPESSLKRSLVEGLSGLQEVEIYRSGESGVNLRGEIKSAHELARVEALSRGFPKEIQNDCEPSPALLESGLRRIQEWLANSSYSTHLRVEQHGLRLWIRGSLPRPAEQAEVEKQIRAKFAAAQFEISALPDSSPTVHFRVYLLELRRNSFGALGLNWPAEQQAAFQIVTQPFFGIRNALQLDLALRALEGNGNAKVLSKPELVVRTPGEAELFAGGEIPIVTTSKFGTQVQWKQHGLTLKLKVTHSAGDQIRLEIFTEVSELDLSTSQSEIPGIQANRLKTQVDARFGSPLFLSGLLKQNTREQARGLPALRKIPILGSLFGSKDYLNEQSELVAVLIPSATPPPAPMEKILPQIPALLNPAVENVAALPRKFFPEDFPEAMRGER